MSKDLDYEVKCCDISFSNKIGELVKKYNNNTISGEEFNLSSSELRTIIQRTQCLGLFQNDESNSNLIGILIFESNSSLAFISCIYVENNFYQGYSLLLKNLLDIPQVKRKKIRVELDSKSESSIMEILASFNFKKKAIILEKN